LSLTAGYTLILQFLKEKEKERHEISFAVHDGEQHSEGNRSLDPLALNSSQGRRSPIDLNKSMLGPRDR
jgi:hypothetical protein